MSFRLLRTMDRSGQVHPLLLWLIALALLGMACRSAPEWSAAAGDHDSRFLAAHAFEDRRFSTEPQDGMVPTGVWRVRGPRNTVYLAATSHLVTSNQVPFPSSYYGAYGVAREIYLEVDTYSSPLSEMRLTFQLARWMARNKADFFYPSGESLQDDLARETIDRLKERYGRDFDKVLRMRPHFLAFMMQVTEMGEQFIEEGGVEDIFAARARIDGKPIRTLDDRSVNKVAMLLLDEMIFEIQREMKAKGADAVINETLSGTNEPIDERAWRRGGLAAVQEEMEEMKEDAPELYEKIGPERNRKWLPKILAALTKGHDVMILAGVAHFGGPEGLLELLERAGFEPEQLYGFDPIFAEEEPESARH